MSKIDEKDIVKFFCKQCDENCKPKCFENQRHIRQIEKITVEKYNNIMNCDLIKKK